MTEEIHQRSMFEIISENDSAVAPEPEVNAENVRISSSWRNPEWTDKPLNQIQPGRSVPTGEREEFED